jgi:hypothetical protein
MWQKLTQSAEKRCVSAAEAAARGLQHPENHGHLRRNLEGNRAFGQPLGAVVPLHGAARAG